MTPSEREEIEKVAEEIVKYVFDCVQNRNSSMAHQFVEAALLTQVAKARREQIEKDTRNFKRLIKIFLGEEAEIEFSEKMAKGWNNLMKFLSEESAIN